MRLFQKYLKVPCSHCKLTEGRLLASPQLGPEANLCVKRVTVREAR